MKTIIVYFVVILALTIASSNAKHSNKQKSKSSKGEEGPDGGMESQEPGGWPNPGSVANFDAPQGFTENIGSDDGEQGSGEQEPSSGKHHGKSSHRGHKN